MIDSTVQRTLHLLVQSGNFYSLLLDNTAAVLWLLTGNQTHEGGFSFTIAADQADPFASLDLHTDLTKDRQTAKGERDIL